MMLSCIAVGAGGFVGAVLRYVISLITVREAMAFPLKTFLINIAGCFAIGCIMALATKHAELDPKLILFFKVGICGGFTTFSTFALETVDLMKTGHTWIALLYLILSCVIGAGLVFAAEYIFKNV